VVDAAFAEERPSLKPLPAIPYSAVLTVERRVSKEGMISVGGNFYSVPDTTRRRTLEVQHHAEELRIFEDGQLIARHPVLEGKARRRVDPAHRKAPPRRATPPSPSQGLRRPLDFYDAVGVRGMSQGRAISALEALANLVVGWIVVLAMQLLVFPVIGLSVTVAQHLGIGAAFTIVSFLRSYCLRHLFERLARRGTPQGGGSISTTSATQPAGAGFFFHGQNSDGVSETAKGR
jgi:hypothetical protein